MTTKKRLAAYGMAATAAIGGGIGGLALGLGVAGSPGLPTQLAASTGAAATNTALPGHPGGPGGAARVDKLTVASQALGMSAEELRAALEGGKSIAQVAKERNVDVQKVIDALVAAHTAAIDKAVADGTMTQAQADERKANLAAHVKADVERAGLKPPGGPGGPGHGGPGGVRVDRLAIASQALGMSAEELRTALQGGKSMAQVAQERNVDVQKVIDALVAAHTAAIDQAVKEGRLTQAQADERKAGVAAHVKADVERAGLKPPGGPGHGGPGGPGGVRVDRLAIASQALGMSAEELRTALQGGKSMAQVAQERNVDVQKVIDALVAAENAAIDQAVKDGRLTQAQADERKAGVAAHVKADVERVGLKAPGGPGGPGHGGPGHGGRRGPGGPPPAGAPSGTEATPSTVVVN